MASINTSTGAISCETISQNQGRCAFKQILFGTAIVPNDSGTSIQVTFSTAFSSAPKVVATASGNPENYQIRFVNIRDITTTGFKASGCYVDFVNGDGVSKPYTILYGIQFDWIAIN